MCADELAYPVAKLGRLILEQGEWPECWRVHWVLPLHKRKSRANPGNYRGIHLTDQISKVMERLIGKLFLPQLVASRGFGPRQFTYTPERGYKDALIVCVGKWILMLSERKRVAIYCSDVAGAVDRVSSVLLMHALASKGLHSPILKVVDRFFFYFLCSFFSFFCSCLAYINITISIQFCWLDRPPFYKICPCTN